ncbi:MAG: hypothetical protein VX464_19825 [Pseudomonadota bacterium]|nr:hypothetical protein [Pseudomonadota bacterium]
MLFVTLGRPEVIQGVFSITDHSGGFASSDAAGVLWFLWDYFFVPFVSVFMFIVASAIWFRMALAPTLSGDPSPSRFFGRREWRLFLVSFVLFGGMSILFSAIAQLPVSPMARGLGLVLGVFVCLYLFGRFAPMLSSAASGGTMRFMQAWQMTKNRGLRYGFQIALLLSIVIVFLGLFEVLVHSNIEYGRNFVLSLFSDANELGKWPDIIERAITLLVGWLESIIVFAYAVFYLTRVYPAASPPSR